MSLTEYREKRNFQRTAEPRGVRADSKSQRFVVQKHDASRLHFDFRLEWNGVLLSWAIPKGPSLNPAQKRLAVQVEDHPLEYGEFEGTIPAGEYGGGTVMLWDRGTWEAEGDPAAALRIGELKFSLHGERLQGAWVLVRLQRDKKPNSKANWLLIKERDEFALPSLTKNPAVLAKASVKTGRSMAAIAAGKKAVAKKTKRPNKPGRTEWKALPSEAPRAALPRSPEAQLATLVEHPPEGDEWLHETKFDGYRMFARVDRGAVRWISRNGHDWTKRLSSLSPALDGLPCKQCLLDGEVVVLDEQGVSRFQRLQNALNESDDAEELQFHAFDCLYLDGYDLTSIPLRERKQVLENLIDQQGPRQQRLRYSEHNVGDGVALLKAACAAGQEGIISKRVDAPYRAGRDTSWQKSKCRMGQELVIGGFTEPAGSRTGFGALLMGYYDDNDDFVYAGRVGTGFDERTLSALSKRMRAMKAARSPFTSIPSGISVRGVHWVKPRLVAQVEFSNWTDDNLLRQAAFLGLREDKPPRTVHRDRPRESTMNNARRNSPDKKNNRASHAELPTLTHADRVLFPDEGITKQNVADFYADIAEWLLPELVHRPLSLVRCPVGTKGSCFFQKHPPRGLSAEVRRIEVVEKRGHGTYLVVDDLPGVIALVQFGALELHVWGAQTDNLERPDRIVFDLDPAPDVAWTAVVEAAQAVRMALEQLELASFTKTSGGKGLHVVVPIERRHTWAQVKSFSKAVGELLVAAAPDRFTTSLSKKARTGKVFIDYLRNERGASTVAAYSTRARAAAPVSTPVAWADLPHLKSATQFTVANLRQRLTSLQHDPWKELRGVRQSITLAMMKRLDARA